MATYLHCPLPRSQSPFQICQVVLELDRHFKDKVEPSLLTTVSVLISFVFIPALTTELLSELFRNLGKAGKFAYYLRFEYEMTATTAH